MKTKLAKLFCSLFLVALLPFGAFGVSAAQAATPLAVYQGILNQQLKATGAVNEQQFIEKHLAKSEAAAYNGTWYALALAQYRQLNFSSYRSALEAYLSHKTVSAASTRLKCALVLAATGSCNSYIYTAMNSSIGKQGIMSWVFGLHMLNNGYSSESYTTQTVVNKLLALQLESGGWCITGKTADVDATAMTLQALAPHCAGNALVKSAVEKALTWLSQKQLSSGDFASYGVENPESTAQVLLALAALNINGLTDARFVKNGNTLLDGILKFRLSNGGFCHQKGGELNAMATEQVFYTMVAVLRQQSGRQAFYLLDVKNPAGVQKPLQASSAAKNASSIGDAAGSRAAGSALTGQATQGAGSRSMQSSAAAGNSAALPSSSSNALQSATQSATLAQSSAAKPQNANKGFQPIFWLVPVALLTAAAFVFYRLRKK